MYCIGQFTSNTLIYATLAQNASSNSLTVCTLGVDLYFLPTPLHHPKKPKHFFFFPPNPCHSPFPSPLSLPKPFQTTRQLLPRALFRFTACKAPARRALAIVLPGMPPSLTFAFPLRLLHNAVPACVRRLGEWQRVPGVPGPLPLPQRVPGEEGHVGQQVSSTRAQTIRDRQENTLTAGAARASQHPPLLFASIQKRQPSVT